MIELKILLTFVLILVAVEFISSTYEQFLSEFSPEEYLSNASTICGLGVLSAGVSIIGLLLSLIW